MSLYTQICSKFIFPVHEKLKKHETVKIKNQLEQSQWFPQEKLLGLQSKRLQNFIISVYANVPYYQELMDKYGINPNEIGSAQDLTKLPFLNKQTITENFDKLISKNARHTSKFNTGGSSGTPLTFLLGNERVSHDVAEKWRATNWWDVDIGDKEIVAWGSPIELTKQDRIKQIRDKLLRTELIPAFDLTESKQMHFLNKILSSQPAMLFGYPSVFHLLAKTAKDNNIDMSNCGIKVVFVTSERLYPYQRELISEVFSAPVANGYGGRDAGFIAHECPQGNLHISAEDIVVEIIDESGNVVPHGSKGEIVVTHMATSDFPFIRYKTGDIGSISTETCSCGRGLPILKEIEGRTTDFVVASDGTKMHGLALIYILREHKEIQEFKIEQQSLTETDVYLVADKQQLEPKLPLILAGFKKRLGDSVTINLNFVHEIEAEKSGKYRYVISKVVS